MEEEIKKKKVNKELTTIQIKKMTRSRLKAFKLVKKESFDELLNRLMNISIGDRK